MAPLNCPIENFLPKIISWELWSAAAVHHDTTFYWVWQWQTQNTGQISHFRITSHISFRWYLQAMHCLWFILDKIDHSHSENTTVEWGHRCPQLTQLSVSGTLQCPANYTAHLVGHSAGIQSDGGHFPSIAHPLATSLVFIRLGGWGRLMERCNQGRGCNIDHKWTFSPVEYNGYSNWYWDALDFFIHTAEPHYNTVCNNMTLHAMGQWEV